MKTKQTRIIENIFDLICSNQFADVARKELNKDLAGSNLSFNPNNNSIKIQDKNGQRVLYTITITK